MVSDLSNHAVPRVRERRFQRKCAASGQKGHCVSRFTDYAQSFWGTTVVLFIAAYLECGGDFFINRAVWKSEGSVRALWAVGGVLVLALYSFFLNSSGLKFSHLLGFYVIFFVFASQSISAIEDRKAPSVMSCLGIVFIAIGSMILRSQSN
jgi:drug/metabolite transporter superfamily protein YnfA